ncbi:response regulator [Pseudomonas sp. NPDC086278]|uniref:response regulator n=1 Tax=Pseudomonas sp. NPDC086278 TaxID=3390646 RepID=UPI003D02145B
MQKIKVVIADDHPIVLLGVRELIERDGRFAVVGEAASSSELVRMIKEQGPDIIVTDYNMPSDSVYGDGLKMIEYLIRHFPDLQILVLTMVSNELIISRLHDLGVAGIVQKSQLHLEIQKALNAVSQHRNYKNPSRNSDTVVPNSVGVNERVASLSARELEILRLFVSGMSQRDIALSQNRSAKTISAQKVTAMRKLEVKTDQQLITYCNEAKLFE